jgi:hypothetical protein
MAKEAGWQGLALLLQDGGATTKEANSPMRNIVMAIGLILAVVTLGCAKADNAVAQGAVTDRPLTVTLASQNNSGISGTAMLIPRGNQTQVLISITGARAGASEPTHIHEGQCGPHLGKIVYPLKNVEDGRSDTTLNVPLSSLTHGTYAINVHESAQNIGTSVACGNIGTLE